MSNLDNVYKYQRRIIEIQKTALLMEQMPGYNKLFSESAKIFTSHFSLHSMKYADIYAKLPKDLYLTDDNFSSKFSEYIKTFNFAESGKYIDRMIDLERIRLYVMDINEALDTMPYPSTLYKEDILEPFSHIETTDDVKINIEEFITIDKENTEPLTIEQVRSEMNNVLNEFFQQKGWIDGINMLIATVPKLKENIIKKFILDFITTLLIGLILNNNPIITQSNDLTYNPPQLSIVKKHIKKSIIQLPLDDEFYRSYRFISIEKTYVYNNKTLSSRVVGELYFGELIYIIEKRKNWSLVEYRSQTGDVQLRGWVLTRYIARFK